MPPRKPYPMSIATLANRKTFTPEIFITKNGHPVNTGKRTLNCAMEFNVDYQTILIRLARFEQSKAPGVTNKALKSVKLKTVSFYQQEPVSFIVLITVGLPIPESKWAKIASALQADSWFLKNDFNPQTPWYEYVSMVVDGATVHELTENEAAIMKSLAAYLAGQITTGKSVVPPSQLRSDVVFSPPQSRPPFHQDLSASTPSSRASAPTPFSPDGSMYSDYSGSQYSIVSPASPASTVRSFSSARAPPVQRDLSVHGLCVSTPGVDYSSFYDSSDGYGYCSGNYQEHSLGTPRTSAALAYTSEHGMACFREGSESLDEAGAADTMQDPQSQLQPIIDESTRDTVQRLPGLRPHYAVDESTRDTVQPPSGDDVTVKSLCIAFLKAGVRHSPDQLDHLIGKLEDVYSKQQGDTGSMATTILRGPQLDFVSAALALEACVIDSLRALTDKPIPTFFSPALCPLFDPGPDGLLGGSRQGLVRRLVETRESALCFEIAFVDRHVNTFIVAVEYLDKCVNPYAKVNGVFPLHSMWDYIKQHLATVSEWIHQLCILAGHIRECILSSGTSCSALDDMMRQVSLFREPPLAYLVVRNRNVTNLSAVVRRLLNKYKSIMKHLSLPETHFSYANHCFRDTITLGGATLRFVTQSHADPFRHLARTPFTTADTVEDFKLFADGVRCFSSARINRQAVPAIPVPSPPA